MEYSEEVLERAKIAVEIGNAILQGKEVQFEDSDSWEHSDTPSLNFSSYNYRVKPEPKYVPFTFEDAKDLIGKVIKSKKDNTVASIVMCTSLAVYYGSDSGCKYGYLFTEFTFLDGTPCGKIKNQ